MNRSLLERAYKVLLDGARKVAPSVAYSELGYAPRWEDNLMTGLPLSEIERDLTKGAGRELEGKLRAAHSSAALVVNTFGPWITAPSSLTFGEFTDFRSVHFEVTCPIWRHRTPPHLDLLVEGDLTVAVESKCTEWTNSKPAVFSPSYDQLRQSHGHLPWFQMLQLREAPNRYRFLDAAQIIKHAFGLFSCYKAREVRLVYL